MKILIVDDDPKYRTFLARGLEESGVLCETVGDGEQAVKLLTERSYDLALLDVMLPGIQGWDVLEALRDKGIDTPVIFVTAKEGLTERVRGLRMGGDDYVVKPFAFEELLARVHAVLRRRHHSLQRHVGDLDVDYIEGKVTRAGEAIDLTRIEWGLLRHFVEHLGETVSRTALLQAVWGMDFDPGTNVVDVHVRRLRQKVDTPFDRPLIHTIRGAGYVLEDRG